MPSTHIAQLNVGVMVAPTDDPVVAEFMVNLDRINAQADAAPGFVWRLQTESGNATDIHAFANPLELVNMSVWETVDELKAYVYRTEHVDFFRRRAEWFEADAKRLVLWNVTAGSVPALDDAVRRLEFLERHGPTVYAFGFAAPPPAVVFEHASGAIGLDDLPTPGFDVAVTAQLDDRVIGLAGWRLVDDRPVETVHVDDDVAFEHLDDALRDQLRLVASRHAAASATT